MPARLSGVDEVGLSGVDEVGLSGVADVDRRRKYCPLEGVPLVKIGLTQESIRGKSGHQTHLPGVDKGPEVIMRPAAFERVGRCSAHPVSPMHACQHLKSGKVKKHVKRDPTQGPLGAKIDQNGPKSTKSWKSRAHKQASFEVVCEIEEDCENEDAAVHDPGLMESPGQSK
jgi:hypothetical protein